MNSEGRTLSIFRANFKSIQTKQIHQINEKDLRKIRYELLSKGRSIKTVYNYLSLIRNIFFFNNKRNRVLSLQINWSELISKPSELPKTTERLTDDEMNSLMLVGRGGVRKKNLFLFASILAGESLNCSSSVDTSNGKMAISNSLTNE